MNHRHNQGSSHGRALGQHSRTTSNVVGIGTHDSLRSTSPNPPQVGSWYDNTPSWNTPDISGLGTDVDWGIPTDAWGNDHGWGTHDSEAEGWPGIASSDGGGWDGRGIHIKFCACTFTYIALTREQFHPPPVEPGNRQRMMELMQSYFDQLSTARTATISSENAVQCQRWRWLMVQNPVAEVQWSSDG